MATKKTKKDEVTTQAAVTAVAGLQVPQVVSQIGILQVDLQNTLANLAATITGKLQQIDQIDTAIVAKKTELKSLYGIEDEAMSLEAIEAQRIEAQLSWQKECQDRDEAWAEADDRVEKDRTREKEEYDYAIQQRNNRDADEFNAQAARRAREEAVRQETLNRGWQEREKAIKSQEEEIVKLKEQAASFDARVKAEGDKKVAIVTAQMKRDHDIEVASMKKDMATAEILHKGQVDAYVANIKGLAMQIDDLKHQLDAARADTKEVIQKTLEAQSKNDAYNALKGAMDSQNASGKNK
jgi:hypothetical protein